MQIAKICSFMQNVEILTNVSEKSTALDVTQASKTLIRSPQTMLQCNLRLINTLQYVVHYHSRKTLYMHIIAISISNCPMKSKCWRVLLSDRYSKLSFFSEIEP